LIGRSVANAASSVITSVNTASGGSDIAQNTFIVIKGTNLVPTSTPPGGVIWSNVPSFAAGLMPTQLNGVNVSVNGKAAYVYFYCSAATSQVCTQDQINVLTPLDNFIGPVQVVAANGAARSAPFTTSLKAVAPSFLLLGATNYVAATHANGTLIGPNSLYPGNSTPAQPGEQVVVYAVGFGLPSTPLSAGSSSQAGSLASPPICNVASLSVPVTFAGLISPGLYQLNLTIPQASPTGDESISCSYTGATTPAGDQITVHP
jgi:uncharacterized protein (TIGR03437 family)